MLVRQRVAEQLVVNAEVFAVDASLGSAGRASGLENEYRFSCKTFRNPSLHGSASQPFVFEGTKALQVFKLLDLTARVPAQLLRSFEPERAPRGRIKVPRDHFTDPCIQLVFTRLNNLRRGRCG